jgi:hypothetical protein
MKLSWHSYQLSMSHRIKCLWNYGVKLSIKSGCFIRVSFHSIWHDSLGNNEMKLSTETGLTVHTAFSNPSLPQPLAATYLILLCMRRCSSPCDPSIMTSASARLVLRPKLKTVVRLLYRKGGSSKELLHPRGSSRSCFWSGARHCRETPRKLFKQSTSMLLNSVRWQIWSTSFVIFWPLISSPSCL